MFEPQNIDYNDWVRSHIPKEWLNDERPIREWFRMVEQNEGLWSVIRSMEASLLESSRQLETVLSIRPVHSEPRDGAAWGVLALAEIQTREQARQLGELLQIRLQAPTPREELAWSESDRNLKRTK